MRTILVLCAGALTVGGLIFVAACIVDLCISMARRGR